MQIRCFLISGRVQQVLNRMKEAGMTPNEKCMVSQKIDLEKLEAIKNLSQPYNISDLLRLLGMGNHVHKFVEKIT